MSQDSQLTERLELMVGAINEKRQSDVFSGIWFQWDKMQQIERTVQREAAVEWGKLSEASEVQVRVWEGQKDQKKQFRKSESVEVKGGGRRANPE